MVLNLTEIVLTYPPQVYLAPSTMDAKIAIAGCDHPRGRHVALRSWRTLLLQGVRRA